MTEAIYINDLIPKDWILDLWLESDDSYLNQIFSEERTNLGISARSDIRLMVPETDEQTPKLFQHLVDSSLFESGSASVNLRYKPSAPTYDISRTLIRTSLSEIEFLRDPSNPSKLVNYMLNMIPYTFAVGKMKLMEAYEKLKE